MTTRTLSWSALALIIVFGGVVVGDQVFASSGLDFLGIVFFGFLGLVLIVLSVAALFRLRAERYRALAPVVILVLGLWVGWPAALELGAWVRETWFRSQLSETEELIHWGTAEIARGGGFAAEWPPSARAACNRLDIRADSLGHPVAYCHVQRHLIYAYDPAGVTASEGWQAREPLAPDWYRLRR